MIQVDVQGLSEIKEFLERTLPEKLQGKAMQGALAKAAKPIVQAARGMAPVDTGRIRRNIYSARSKFGQTRTYSSRIVGVHRGKSRQKKDNDAFYWKFQEFGRAAITSKKGVLGTPEAGWFGKSVKAAPARPFMRPAFEANKLRAIEIFTQEIRGQIESVARRNIRRQVRAARRSVIGF